MTNWPRRRRNHAAITANRLMAITPLAITTVGPAQGIVVQRQSAPRWPKPMQTALPSADGNVNTALPRGTVRLPRAPIGARCGGQGSVPQDLVRHDSERARNDLGDDRWTDCMPPGHPGASLARSGRLRSRERARGVPDEAVPHGASRSAPDTQIRAGPAIEQVTDGADNP